MLQFPPPPPHHLTAITVPPHGSPPSYSFLLGSSPYNNLLPAYPASNHPVTLHCCDVGGLIDLLTDFGVERGAAYSRSLDEINEVLFEVGKRHHSPFKSF